MKKFTLAFMAILLVLVMVAPQDADARGRGGFKSPVGSYKNTPANKDSNVSQTTPTSKSPGATTGTGAANRGFFSGGSFAKGLLVGGLAGMLFGGLFGGMGFLGDILGLLVNIGGIIIVIFLAARLFNYFTQRSNRYQATNPRNPDEERYRS